MSLARTLFVAGMLPCWAVAQDAAVIDCDAGTGSLGALFRVNLATGARTLVSDFGNPSQGPTGVHPWSLAVTSRGLAVIDPRAGSPCAVLGCGAVFLVDPATGIRTLLSDFGNAAQGPTSIGNLALYGIAADANGDLLVTDRTSGGSGRGLLFRVSLANGTRTVVSNFADPAQGPLGGEPSGVAVESSGSILVADANTGSFPSGAVFRINQTTGQRTIVSDFANAAQGPLGGLPVDVHPTGGVLWVADQFMRSDPRAPGNGQLFRVDAGTGARTLVSDFSTAAQGPLGFNLNDVKTDSTGPLLVMDFDAGTNSAGALFTVDPVTGARSYLSDFGNGAQGPLGVEPSGFVLLAPPPPPTNTLTVVLQGDGVGLVYSNPPGINCGNDCTENYPPSLVVQMTAVTGPNTRFTGWGGHPDCGDGIVQMNLAQTCVATFVQHGGKIILAPDLSQRYESPDVVQLGTLADPGPYRINTHFDNYGPVAAGPSLTRVYLSADRKVSADDILIAEKVMPALPAGPSGTYQVLADRVLKGLEGTYYVILVFDALNQVAESDEKNNVFINRYDFPCHAGISLFSSICPPK
ncbi:MAG: hypothetical protein HY820_13405 [Acidobacteria bacterium]|nr:hypothetical protein [Acidobacteriota bacterium]